MNKLHMASPAKIIATKLTHMPDSLNIRDTHLGQMTSLDIPGPVRVTRPLAWSPILYLRYAYSAISIKKATKQSIIERNANRAAVSSVDIFGTKENSSAAKVTMAPVVLGVRLLIHFRRATY